MPKRRSAMFGWLTATANLEVLRLDARLSPRRRLAPRRRRAMRALRSALDSTRRLVVSIGRNTGRIPRNQSTKANRGTESFSIPRALVARGRNAGCIPRYHWGLRADSVGSEGSTAGSWRISSSSPPFQHQLPRYLEPESSPAGLLDPQRARPFVEALAQGDQARLQVVLDRRQADLGIEADFFA